jgi:hypothetical protein
MIMIIIIIIIMWTKARSKLGDTVYAKWKNRGAAGMNVGEGQKRRRCIDSPVWRRGGVKCSENGGVVVLHG